MSVSGNDYYGLNMNIGQEQSDYRFLLPDVKVKKEETIPSLLKKYKEEGTSNKKNKEERVTEKLFFLLQNEDDKDLNSAFESMSDDDKKEIALLLFKDGLDILESRLYNKSLSKLLKQNIETLLEILNDRIKDKFGAAKFIEMYPNLSDYLKKNYNDRLPSALQATTLEQIKSIIKNLKFATPIQRQFQSIKDRLSVNFFEKVISSPKKPAFITLQEVSRMNEASLKVLEDDYTIIRSSNSSDAAIAIDKNRFEGIVSYPISDSQNMISENMIAAFAQDKATKEEFIFVSVHIRGYSHGFPENKNEMDRHLQGVQRESELAAGEINQLNNKIAELKKKHPNAKVIIQGDLNTFPEYFDSPKINRAIKQNNIFS